MDPRGIAGILDPRAKMFVWKDGLESFSVILRRGYTDPNYPWVASRVAKNFGGYPRIRGSAKVGSVTALVNMLREHVNMLWEHVNILREHVNMLRGM